MKLKRLFNETIAHFPREIQEALLAEQPHTRVSLDGAPESLKFLGGFGCFTDLGFENLGLSVAEFKSLALAFSGNGVRFPPGKHGHLKLRNARSGFTVIEPAEGDEPILPAHWAEAVLVVDPDGQPSWIGNRVRASQYGEIDPAKYVRQNGGMWLKAVFAGPSSPDWP